MSNTLLHVALGLLLVGLWAAVLVKLDIFTPSDVRAWRRLAILRGYATPPSRVEALVLRTPAFRQFQESLDINRLLGIVNRSETPVGFLIRQVAIGGFVCVGVLIFDSWYRVTNGDWILGLGPWIAFAAWGVAVLILLVDLRAKARKRQMKINKALGDMLMLVAIMTAGRGLQLEDAVRILSRCLTTDVVESLVEHRGWRRLVKEPSQNTIELYRKIGAEYGIPTFLKLADAAANTNVGFSERDTFTRLAKAVYQQRLAEARMKAARAKIVVTLPVAGMLIPLLVLLGAPTFHSITTGFGAGP